jgi:topoisomerase-4 subunit B
VARQEDNITLRKYDDSSIRTLSALEHIQQRPGMYIGRLGTGDHPDDGIYVLLKEILDNSVDEYSVGAGKRIEVLLDEEGGIRVRDYGRGIPLDSVVACVSQINTGGKFMTDADGQDRAFACSIGLNGVGLKAVNALSQSFVVCSHRSGRSHKATFAEGVLVNEERSKSAEPDGTEVYFLPSEQFFHDFHFEPKHIRRRMQHYAWLNSGLSLSFNGEKFYSRRGLLDLLEAKQDSEPLYPPLHYRSPMLEFAFSHSGSFNESYYSFVNGQYTNDGGTHLSAFKEGILKGVNEMSQKGLDGDDVRNGIVGAVAIRLDNPIFESQTKNKLGNTEIRVGIVNQVRKAVAEVLYKNPDLKAKLLEKVTQNETVRKQIQVVRREAREQAKKTSLKIPKLRDCKYHLCDAPARRKEIEKIKCSESLLFLTEGDSAAANMVSARDPETQAVFPLRGKPLNCYGKKKETIYKNEEFYYIMQALGVEESMDDLRYGRIIIASDADVDGFHIRNLLITFFLTYFQPLVLSDHLFILETPLYRVRNKKKTYYCFNDRERDEAIAKLGKSHEITRFKGLGEISPNEFGPFIGSDMRLLPVNVENVREIDGMLGFFMGDNTPNRRDYIMENLR